ncbi:MAG: hypothetical protein JXQ66_00750, partial [Campylobacterales bacterium]|nr:hypothetical protein [Campylobacterales bacterium]
MQTKEILALIKNLRDFKGSEDEFWSEYLKGVCLLTKSQFSLAINLKNNTYEIMGKYEIEQTQLEEVLKDSKDSISRALENGFSYEPVRYSWAKNRRSYVVFFTLESLEDKKIVALMVEKESSSVFNEIVLRTQLISDVYLSYKNNLLKNTKHSVDVVSQVSEESSKDLKNVLEIVSMMTKQNSFLLACMTLVNELSVRFDATTVNIGWEEDGYVKPIAISHLEKFDKNTDIIHKLEAVFEESYDQNEEIIFPDNQAKSTIVYAHNVYFRDKNLSHLVSLPLRVENDSVG